MVLYDPKHSFIVPCSPLILAYHLPAAPNTIYLSMSQQCPGSLHGRGGGGSDLVPFCRVFIFRELLKADKASLGLLPPSPSHPWAGGGLAPITVIIRRNRIVEDGFAQLSGIGPKIKVLHLWLHSYRHMCHVSVYEISSDVFSWMDVDCLQMGDE